MFFDTEIKNAIAQLSNGGVILYPTDTVWGLGCDATNPDAVQKIYALKNREESKSLVILVSSLDMLKSYIREIPEKAIELIKNGQKPTTIIYQNPSGLAGNTVAIDNSIAIRIPKHIFCTKLIEEFGKPIVSTSANLSSYGTPTSFSEIDASILEGADYIVNLEREKITDKSSTIVRIHGDDVEVIRA
ncbi:L-threonylcarbamoyladenylate synthase [Flavobacteriaceae bacterium S356]|uniref:L-threonylcarbamoyladenylate synthase n=1 Tax=Asprobacillus argus TaxID=3076534 RepID=A0ABU3LHG5_9FLAO|nr:L-threonylcarbamoyladenylate synthase [Flavobacteriaceae bacterium S356]